MNYWFNKKHPESDAIMTGKATEIKPRISGIGMIENTLIGRGGLSFIN